MHTDLGRLLPLFLIFLFKAVTSAMEIADEVLVRTVPGGSKVILSCLSNDEDHNFQFWHFMKRRLIIGPANNYDKSKFRFEVLTGNLTIKAVTKEEEGVYVCFSRAVIGENINVKIVRIVVQSICDLDDIFENDFNITLIKFLIAAIALVLVSMAAWFGYGIWKDRYRYPSYLQNEDDDDDDESTEEIFSQPSTSRSAVNNIVPTKAKSPSKESSFVDVDISTDFKSILDTANEK